MSISTVAVVSRNTCHRDSEWPDTRPSILASAARRWTMAGMDTVLSRAHGWPATAREWPGSKRRRA